MEHEDLASFMSITGSDTDTAQQYLEMTNYNMEQAINLFMESGGQSSSYGQSSGASMGFDFYANENVIRAPDPSKRQRLVGEVADSYSTIRSMANMPNSIFQRDFAAESIASMMHHENQPNTRRDPTNLSELFQPPVTLMFHGTLSDAKVQAKQESKWILANIQDESIFSSLMLNRDTWSDDIVQNVVASEFIFWQVSINSENGKKFCALYEIDNSMLPVTCIINPRTSKKHTQWFNFIEPGDMTEKLSDFCCLNSLIEEPSKAAPSCAPLRQDEFGSNDVVDLSEEDALAAAIAQSLESSEPSEQGNTNGNSVDSNGAAAIASNSSQLSLKPLSAEPSEKDPNAIRVQIRACNGKRLIRRFLKSDPISSLWSFIQQEMEEAKAKAFELRTAFPPKSIPFSETQTITEAQLENANLMMSWV